MTAAPCPVSSFRRSDAQRMRYVFLALLQTIVDALAQQTKWFNRFSQRAFLSRLHLFVFLNTFLGNVITGETPLEDVKEHTASH